MAPWQIHFQDPPSCSDLGGKQDRNMCYSSFLNAERDYSA